MVGGDAYERYGVIAISTPSPLTHCGRRSATTGLRRLTGAQVAQLAADRIGRAPFTAAATKDR
jgi:hypothetical protein